MLRVNHYEQDVAACILDFCRPTAPWQRRLWGLGSILGIREALEASEAAAEGHLSNRATKMLCAELARNAGPDPGLGSAALRRALTQCLKSEVRRDSGEYVYLQEILGRTEGQYLLRWAKAVDQPDPATNSPERAAKAIAAHLLDSGFSPQYLQRWYSYRIRYEPGTRTLAEILGDAANLDSERPRTFDIMVPVVSTPHDPERLPEGWLDAPQTSRWLRDHEFSTSGLRQCGGFLMRIEARDPWGAVEIVNERLERFSARVELGAKAILRDCGKVWIADQEQPLPLSRLHRFVEIGALKREHRLYDDEGQSRLDSALELAAPLNSGGPSPAISGGWAAVETLLYGAGDSGDRGVAGDRLASIIACSFTRAECTKLAYTYANTSDDNLSNQLSAATSNRHRAEIFVAAFKQGIRFDDPADQVACTRIRGIFDEPRERLSDIETYLVAALRRLYRQRNLVLHWGRTQGPCLRATLRTTAPLIGAGLDRLSHAHFVEGLTPLELASRARLNLDLLGSTEGVSPVLLLESRQ